MSTGWKALLATAAIITVCSPLGVIAVPVAGVAVQGGRDCAAVLASPTPSPTPESLQGGCDGGDGLPDLGDLGQLPAGYQLPTNAQQATVVAFALAQLGEPYVFGAAGPDRWDCSGLLVRAWQQVGVQLTHSTYYMINEGVRIPGLQAMQPGDLIFIPGSNGTRQHPGHVGMYIGPGADGRQWLVQAPHTGSVVKTTPVDSWAGKIVAVVRPVLGGARRLDR